MKCACHIRRRPPAHYNAIVQFNTGGVDEYGGGGGGLHLIRQYRAQTFDEFINEAVAVVPSPFFIVRQKYMYFIFISRFAE